MERKLSVPMSIQSIRKPVVRSTILPTLLTILIALTACSKKDETRSTLTLALPDISSGPQGKIGSLSTEVPTFYALQVQGPGITEPIIWSWDAHCGSSSCASAPSTISLDIPRGDSRVIQFLGVWSSDESKTETVRYGDVTKSLSATEETADIMLTTVTTLGEAQYSVAGRYLSTADSGPSGNIAISFNPPNARPAMNIKTIAMYGGWFTAMLPPPSISFNYRFVEAKENLWKDLSLSSSPSPLAPSGALSSSVLQISYPAHVRQRLDGSSRYESHSGRTYLGFFGPGANGKSVCFEASTFNLTVATDYQQILTLGSTPSPLRWNGSSAADPTRDVLPVSGGAPNSRSDCAASVADYGAKLSVQTKTFLRSSEGLIPFRGPFKPINTSGDYVKIAAGSASGSVVVQWNYLPGVNAQPVPLQGSTIFFKSMSSITNGSLQCALLKEQGYEQLDSNDNEGGAEISLPLANASGLRVVICPFRFDAQGTRVYTSDYIEGRCENGSCSGIVATPTPIATVSPTPTPVQTVTPSPTPFSTPFSTASPTPSPSPSATPVASPSPTATPSMAPPPSTALIDTPASLDKATALHVQVVGNGVAYYKYKLGDASITDCTDMTGYSGEFSQNAVITNPLTGFADGPMRLCVRARNADGVYQSTPSAHNWVKDTTPPSVSSISISPAAVGNVLVPMISGSAEPSSIIEIYDGFACTGTKRGEGTSSGGFYVAANLTTDGVYNFYIRATDSLGNSACATGPVYQLDRQAPIASFWSSEPDPTGATSFIVNLNFNKVVTGLTTDDFQVSNATVSSSSLTGSGLSYSFTLVPTGPGNVSVSLYGSAVIDSAGNGNNLTGPFSRAINWNGPSLTQTMTASSFRSSANNMAFGGSCTDGLAVQIKVNGSYLSSAGCSSGTWSYSVSAPGGDGAHNYEFSQTDGFAQTTSIYTTWIRDTMGPQISGFQLAGGASSVRTALAQIALQAQDSLSSVTQLCIKDTSAAPPASDACWFGVSANPTVSLTAHPYLLGILPGSYNLYAWAKDDLGNMSSLSASGVGTAGLDRLAINYNVTPPPIVHWVQVSNSSSMGGTSSERSIAQDQVMYVRWKITSPTAIPITQVNIQYTLDGLTWNALSSATSLPEGANNCGAGNVDGPGGADNGATGCFIGNAPSGNYFKLRVTAYDSQNASNSLDSNQMNLGSFQIIAGNLSRNDSDDADSAVFKNAFGTSFTYADNGGLVIDKIGVVYWRDPDMGIYRIDPADRKMRLFMAKSPSGARSLDSSNAWNTVLADPYKITLDPMNRLLILDRDRILRVDTNLAAPTVTVLAGGGAITSQTSGISAGSFQFSFVSGYMYNDQVRYAPFFALPNGDIYFVDTVRPASGTTEKYFRVYRDSTALIDTLSVSGTGNNAYTSQDLNLCGATQLAARFDSSGNPLEFITHANTASGCTPGLALLNSSLGAQNVFAAQITPQNTLSLLTGMDGNIYVISPSSGRILRFDHSSKTWVSIAGNGIAGTCDDGMMATSCSMRPSNLFVTADGKVFFADRGRIRTITSSGYIMTVYGQGYDSGDNGSPTLARFAKLEALGSINDGRIVVLDHWARLFRELDTGRTLITPIAGNGSLSLITGGAGGLNAGLGDSPLADFAVSPVSGEVYWPSGQKIRVLNRTSGTWQDAVGGSSMPFYSSDSYTGASLMLPSDDSLVAPLAFANSKLVVHVASSNAADSYVKTYDPFDSYRQASLLGWSAVGSLCSSGTVSTCSVPSPQNTNGTLRATLNTYTSNWLIAELGASAVRSISVSSVNTFRTTLNPIQAFAYRRNGATDIIYYCATNGTLNKSTADGSETPIALPPEHKCVGRSLLYSGTTLQFVVEAHGFRGVAEVTDP